MEISCIEFICLFDTQWMCLIYMKPNRLQQLQAITSSKWISIDCSLCGCATGLQWAWHCSQRDHHQSGVLLQPQRSGQGEGQSRPRPECPDPWRHTPGGADLTSQVTGHTHNQEPFPSDLWEWCVHWIGFVSQVFHRCGAADEDGVEGGSGGRAAGQEETSSTADWFVQCHVFVYELLLKWNSTHNVVFMTSCGLICAVLCVSCWQMMQLKFTAVRCSLLAQRTLRWDADVVLSTAETSLL